MKIFALITIFITLTGCCIENQKGDLTMHKYTIKVVDKMDMFYEVNIFQQSNNEKLQTIELRNGKDPANEGATKILYIDKIPHLVILGGQTEQGKWYKLWKMDSTTGQFIWLKTTKPGEKIY